MIEIIEPSEEERAAGSFESGTIERAAQQIRAQGALILRNVVDPRRILEAKATVHAAYAHYLDASDRDDTLRVGAQRLMIDLDLEPPFDEPGLFANPWLLPILAKALDDDFVVGAYGVVCSLPGAPTQHRHRDGGVLFPASGIDHVLPTSAVTVGIPLIEMNEIHGTTTLWLGSHRDASGVAECETVEPVVSEGSLVLWDFRLKHSGTANRSDVPRPLLYLTYCRPWWVDHRNFPGKTMKTLRARKRSLNALAKEHRRILSRVEEF